MEKEDFWKCWKNHRWRPGSRSVVFSLACGGCMYQTMSYEEQVKMKEGQIHRIMDPVVKGDYIFESVKESPKEFHYRNKNGVFFWR